MPALGFYSFRGKETSILIDKLRTMDLVTTRAILMNFIEDSHEVCNSHEALMSSLNLEAAICGMFTQAT